MEDPAHSGSTRPIDIEKGQHEARVGLELEERGDLKNITRDATVKAEFIDGNGQAWDVKSFNFEKTKILLMNAFRTTFMYGRF